MHIFTLALLNTVTILCSYQIGKLAAQGRSASALLELYKKTNIEVQELSKLKDTLDALSDEEKKDKYSLSCEIKGRLDILIEWGKTLGIKSSKHEA